MKVVIVACPWAEKADREGARSGVMESITMHRGLGSPSSKAA